MKNFSLMSLFLLISFFTLAPAVTNAMVNKPHKKDLSTLEEKFDNFRTKPENHEGKVFNFLKSHHLQTSDDAIRTFPKHKSMKIIQWFIKLENKSYYEEEYGNNIFC